MSDGDNRSEPSFLVIFGITGDLSRRYLLPSLYELIRAGKLNEKTRIFGITRGDHSVNEVFQNIKLGGEDIDQAILKDIQSRTTMIKMDLDNAEAYKKLLEILNEAEAEANLCVNRLYYLSIPPKAYLSVIDQLGNADLNKSCLHGKAATRLLVEKPFGYDTESAKELIAESGKLFNEDQIFRIDHYVAKDTVQNLIKFRFNTPAFEGIWNNRHVEAIEIIAKQKIGIEGRAVFYEPLGALRDFIQSHLIQILGLLLMDKPEHMNSDQIHQTKQAALDQIKSVYADKVDQFAVRGQYEGYREEVNNPQSTTETFAQITVFSESKRWKNVPMKLMTGKALDEQKTEIHVKFKDAKNIAGDNDTVVFNIQSPGAYQRVLLDAIAGDHTIFATSQEILTSWKIVQPVLDAWQKDAEDLQFYPQGSAGPSR